MITQCLPTDEKRDKKICIGCDNRIRSTAAALTIIRGSLKTSSLEQATAGFIREVSAVSGNDSYFHQ
ncbi:hypothetical protein RRG08_051026 [Elysia crispata]|uniref:Uncharacterized protein n=1 Tax=Elysia crispata TaxID=231223 RepID=A0AAE0Z4Z9_9GAST|nr:hypothetical protein RRG08_051026 [Elysia crispata]